jgi:hypothetical protein
VSLNRTKFGLFLTNTPHVISWRKIGYQKKEPPRRLLAVGVFAAFSALLLIRTAGADEHPGSSGVTNPIGQYPLAQLTATRERPLFLPTRRPARIEKPIVTAAPAPAPAPPPNMSLVGTILDGNRAQALVRMPPKPVAIKLHIGDVIAGWRITQIEAQRIVIALGDRFITLRLFDSAQANTVSIATPEITPRAIPNVKRAVNLPVIPQSLVNGISFRPE